MTKLAGKLPKGDADGLSAINHELVKHPGESFVIVAMIDCSKVTTDTDYGFQEATARVLRIESVLKEDSKRAVQMLVRAQEQRLGRVVLPIEMDEDLRVMLGKVDFRTGEIRPDDEDN